METPTKIRIRVQTIGDHAPYKIKTLSTGGTMTPEHIQNKTITLSRYIEPKTPRNTIEEIKVAISQHKEALKNPETYRQIRDDLVRTILNIQTPKWGTVKMKIVDWRKKPRRTSPTY